MTCLKCGDLLEGYVLETGDMQSVSESMASTMEYHLDKHRRALDIQWKDTEKKEE